MLERAEALGYEILFEAFFLTKAEDQASRKELEIYLNTIDNDDASVV